MARHSWSVTAVEVPWSAMPGNLYSCRRCGMKRQSVPISEHIADFYEYEFTAPDGTTTRGKTPPCTPKEAQDG